MMKQHQNNKEIISFLFIMTSLLSQWCQKAASLSILTKQNIKRPSSSLPSSSKKLDKKSTALDVLRYLNQNNKLASYIHLDDDDHGENDGGKQRPVAVVTGGSSGIGIPSIEALTLANMNVVLCARNVQAAKEAMEKNLPASLQKKVRIQPLDLSDMNSIQAAAEEIKRTERNIHVLLNNAGVMAPPKRERTVQGLELQFGTNHVGHHMLTRLILPNMVDSGRIVTVASTAHAFGQLNFDDLNYETAERGYSPWGAYGQSKLANVLFAKGLSDKLKAEGSRIKSVSLHPGVIGTNLWRYTPKWTRPFLNAFLTDKNAEQGAATNVYGCLVDGSEFEGGEYLVDCQISEPNQNGKDESGSLRQKLWNATEGMIEKNGFQLPRDLLYE
jgi:WW domain-containing oxidoreductase